MIQIFKKELKSYLLNPLGYIFLAIFFAVASMLFSIENVGNEASNFAVVLTNLRIGMSPTVDETPVIQAPPSVCS